MQSIEFPSDTDGALSPPVRSSYNKSTGDLLKRKLSMLESQTTHAGSAMRQQRHTAFHQSTKSGNYQHHTNPAKPLDMILQNKRVANDAHSIASPAGGPSALYGNQSDVQRQLEARRKAAAAAQERKNAFERNQAAAQRLASDRESNAAAGQRLGDQRAEHDAARSSSGYCSSSGAELWRRVDRYIRRDASCLLATTCCIFVMQGSGGRISPCRFWS